MTTSTPVLGLRPTRAFFLRVYDMLGLNDIAKETVDYYLQYDKGKPVDAGVLTVATASGEGLQHMKDIASAQTFAMTVEPLGGSVGPTLSTMTVVGNI